jgi:regulator of replication initiation timing
MDNITRTDSTDALRLSQKEQEVLSLWDQLEEQRLERALLTAQPPSVSEAPQESLAAEVEVAEQALLEARTTYMLKNKITTNAIIADPILKSVHQAASATAIERRLLPLIQERDAVSLVHSHLSQQLRDLQHKFSQLEDQIAKLNGENQALAAELFQLTDALKDQTVEELDDPRLIAELDSLDEDIKRAKRRWRVMKSLVKGIIVGSGVEWARRPELLEVVLDDEGDG